MNKNNNDLSNTLLENATLSKIFNNAKKQLERECPNILQDSDLKYNLHAISAAFQTLYQKAKDKNDNTIIAEYNLDQICASLNVNSEQITPIINTLIPFCVSNAPTTKHINSAITILIPWETFNTQVNNFTIPNISINDENKFAVLDSCEEFLINLKQFYYSVDWKQLSNMAPYLYNINDTGNKLQNFIKYIETFCNSYLFISKGYYSCTYCGEMTFGKRIPNKYWASMERDKNDNTIYLNGIADILKSPKPFNSIQDIKNFYKNRIKGLKPIIINIQTNLIDLHTEVKTKFNDGYKYMCDKFQQLPTSALTRTR